MTLGEVLIRPLREGRWDLVSAYEAIFNSPAVLLVSFDRACARLYAQLRQDPTIRAPDGIQLACAAHVKCDMLITNDDHLSRKVVPGIQFIVSLERAPL
jgi:predicted nucleic acid-binding protein